MDRLRWQQEGLPPLRVSVNLSARQFAHESLLQDVTRVLNETGLDPASLEFEITETAVMTDIEASRILLVDLASAGFRIALDDFGTGYSSLGYLNKAVFHKLKIDGSFVREAAKNKETVAIIQSIVQLAKSFRMSVTAEGVETAEDFERMRDLGCDTIQGYLFGRPLAYERANEMVLGLVSKRMAG